MKSLFMALSWAAITTANAIAAEVPSIRLVVLPLDSETIQECESSAVQALTSHGFQTQVLKQGQSVVKVWGMKRSKLYAIQLECDTELKTKAFAFTHPYTDNSPKIDKIIDTVLRSQAIDFDE